MQEAEGTIKFRCNWQPSGAIESPALQELIQMRSRLFRMGLIGADEQGVGFGNISQREDIETRFVISGSGTGALPEIDNRHFARVLGYSIDANALHCTGAVRASSESLTHAALYECSSQIRAVIHVHNDSLWRQSLDSLPTSAAHVPYGTPAMAREIFRLVRRSKFASRGLVIMAGHQGGIVSYGESLQIAFREVEKLLSEAGVVLP